MLIREMKVVEIEELADKKTGGRESGGPEADREENKAERKHGGLIYACFCRASSGSFYLISYL